MAQKIKKIVLIADGNIGGAQSWVFRRYGEKRLKSIEFYMLSHGRLCDNLEDRGFNVQVFGPFCLFFKLIKNLFLAKNVIIECHSTMMGIIGRIVALICRVKCTYVSHGWGVKYRSSWSAKGGFLIEKILGRLNYKILCVSEADADYAKNVVMIKHNCVKVLRYKKYIYSNNQTKIKNIYVVMRNAEPKRYDLVKLLAVNFSELNFYCFGLKAGQLGEAENLYPMGLVNNVDYQNCDAVMLLSDSEGMPIVALEAAENRKLLLISRLPIVEELKKLNIQLFELDNSKILEDFSMFLSDKNLGSSCYKN